MRRIAAATEADMVATFCRAELASSRFDVDLLAALRAEGADLDLLEHPDTTDPVANAVRRRILAAYREFPGGVFTGVPPDTTWEWVALTRAELGQVRYIDWGWWLQVTAGSRRPTDALEYYATDPACQAIVADIVAGRMPPEIIIVARPGPVDLVVLEGHLRLTAFAIAADHLPPEITVLLGTSAAMAR